MLKGTFDNVFGVVAEFNPFHSGHERLADAARSEFGAEFVVAVMSGDFVQRGAPAVFDKWKRAESALDGGYDLVLELPAALAVRHGGDFARNAVDILAGTGMVTDLIFGSESGDIGLLKRMAENIDLAEKEGADRIRALCKDGLSFPAARQRIVEEQLAGAGDDPLISAPVLPNDILGVEYLRAISDHPGIVPHTLKRDTDYMESAENIRKKMEADPITGPKLAVMEKRWFDLLRYAALSRSAEYIDSLPSGGEGLGNRILKQLRYASDLDDLTDRVKSRRYTRTRIQRLFAQLVLGIEREERTSPYIRVLAAGPGGRTLLRGMSGGELNSIPLITDILMEPEDSGVGYVLRKEREAADVYSIISGADMYRSADMVRKPAVR